MRNPFVVVHHELRLPDRDAPIIVGSEEWADWLAQNNSFRFEAEVDDRTIQAVSFSATKEVRHACYNSIHYWYASKRIGSKICKAYMGKVGRSLTLEKLKTTGIKLALASIGTPHPSSLALKRGNSDRAADSVDSLRSENEQLRMLVTKLEEELAAATTNAKVYLTQAGYFEDQMVKLQLRLDSVITESESRLRRANQTEIELTRRVEALKLKLTNLEKTNEVLRKSKR